MTSEFFQSHTLYFGKKGIVGNCVFLSLFFLISLMPGSAFGQHTVKPSVFHKNAIYIICRGADSKVKNINTVFNNGDFCITHIGIGFYNGRNLEIYSVTPSIQPNGTCLKRDDLKGFTAIGSVFYVSIWEKDITHRNLKRLKANLKRASQHPVDFDWDFSLCNDRFYCSEFVYSILRETETGKWPYSPKTIRLPMMFKSFLHKDYLTYIPLDFFEEGSAFKKVYERFY